MLGAGRLMTAAAVGFVCACGGSTSSNHGGAGSTSTGGIPNTGGASATGGSISPGGASSSGGSVSSGGSISTGGSRPTGGTGAGPSGGTGGSLLYCDTPYSGPLGGPRADGPPALGACAQISDAQVLARYDDFSARMPQGLYWEPPDNGGLWEDPCSPSLDETVARGSATSGIGTFEASFTTDWFYEATFCSNGVRHAYRNLRCDYFDGTKLQPATDDNLAFLSSLLWWRSNYSMSGYAFLGYALYVGNATDWIEVCTLRTVGGDFGLCDQITLESTTNALRYDGTVELGTPTDVRTIQGKCH